MKIFTKERRKAYYKHKYMNKWLVVVATVSVLYFVCGSGAIG